MFRSLRSRLLLSYLIVIGVVLLIVLIVLPVTISQFRNRLTQRPLSIISRTVQRELTAQGRQSDRPINVEQILLTVAETQNVRVILVETQSERILFDTKTDSGWVGQKLNEVGRFGLFNNNPTQDSNGASGQFRANDGSQWIFFSQLMSGRGAERTTLIVAEPQLSALNFLRLNFLGPLLWTGAIALLLAFLLAFLVARSVARPLQRMALAAESIAEGEYEQQLVPAGPDEVQRLAQSFNHMAAKVNETHAIQRDFLNNVAHELKTPLTSIQGWSQAIVDGMVTEPESQSKAASIIHEEAGRMSRMVSELLDLARIASGRLQLRLESVDINQLIADVHRNLLLQAQQKGVHLTLEAKTTPPIRGDYDRLVQVFMNLVDNGLTHTPAGGRVHIALQQIQDHQVQITIQDTGKGIPPEELGRIFERFYQVSKARHRPDQKQGFGLGLAITKNLIDLHQGRITVRSEVGKGTLFTVRLPVHPEGSTITRRRV